MMKPVPKRRSIPSPATYQHHCVSEDIPHQWTRNSREVRTQSRTKDSINRTLLADELTPAFVDIVVLNHPVAAESGVGDLVRADALRPAVVGA